MNGIKKLTVNIVVSMSVVIMFFSLKKCRLALRLIKFKKVIIITMLINPVWWCFVNSSNSFRYSCMNAPRLIPSIIKISIVYCVCSNTISGVNNSSVPDMNIRVIAMSK